MKKVICDKCHKDCGETYYKVCIYGYPTDDESSGINFNAASQNLYTLVSPTHLCDDCRKKIEAFISSNKASI